MGDGADHSGDGRGDGRDDGRDDGALDDTSSDLVANARRRHGAAGGMLAAGMLGLDQVLGRKPRGEAPIVVAAPTDPIDVDADGISVPIDDSRSVVAPALPRTAPKVTPGRRRRR